MRKMAWVTERLSGPAQALGAGFAGRSRREQGLLVLCLVLVAGGALVQWGWRPLAAARVDLLATIARHDQALAVLARLPAADTATGAGAARADPRPLSEMLTDSADAYGLTIHRLETRGDAAEVLLEEAAYDGLILWLDELEAVHGVRLVAVDLARRPVAGAVTARLTVARVNLAGGQPG